MTILAVDTSTLVASVALVDKEVLLDENNLTPGETHSRTLLPQVRKMLDLAGLDPGDLEFIAVGLGPGSFTGLRIGLAAVKGLAWAAGLPLVGVPTLDAMVASLPLSEAVACPVIDARKDQLYAAFYKPGLSGQWVRQTDYASFTVEGLKRVVREKTLFIGQGLIKYEELLAGVLGDLFCRGPRESDYPRATYIAGLARQQLDQGKDASPSSLTPLYVRPPDIRQPKPKASINGRFA
jgi:tRNA threonylcarbamoyladenosine biosynthesis protein TsaB